MTERPIRLFVPPTLGVGAVLPLAAPQAHYLGRVMRCRSGDRIRLFDGVTGEWLAVLQIGRRDSVATVEARLAQQRAEPGPILAMPPLRRARLEWAIEKATELGIAAYQPVATERSADERLNPGRLRSIAIEAAEQSERLTVPAILPLVSLGAWLADRAARPPLYVLRERSAAVDLATAVRAHGPGDLLVGPEGGFAPGDHTLLATARSGVASSLGPRILRAETAAIAGLAVLATAAEAGAAPAA